MRSVDPATQIMLDQNLEEANADATNWHKRISVLPAEDGETLADEVREITDGEAVEILESIDMGECDMTAKANEVAITELREKVTNLESRLFDYNGDKGHISRTEAMFKELREDSKEGFSTIHKLLKSMDETLQHALSEQKARIDCNEKAIAEHTENLKQINERHDAEDEEKKDTRRTVKKYLIGGALGNGGLVAACLLYLKARLSGG